MLHSLSPDLWRSRLSSQLVPLLLLLAVGWCLVLLAGRIYLTRDGQYSFLLWNLFLAAVPLCWSHLLSNEQSTWKFCGFAALWLLFFPNAPYILTDFVHLHAKSRPEVPTWYDVGMLANFGVVALLLGIVSLRQVHAALESRIGAGFAAVLVSCCSLLAGFGVYLGRFLRWNSWDIVTRPWTLMADVADRFLQPHAHPRTWIFTLMYGGTLMLLYWISYYCSRHEQLRDPRHAAENEIGAQPAAL